MVILARLSDFPTSWIADLMSRSETPGTSTFKAAMRSKVATSKRVIPRRQTLHNNKDAILKFLVSLKVFQLIRSDRDVCIY